jgi:hypothetical protein
VNLFQRWVIDALLILHKRARHIEAKQDILLQHLGAALPPELVKAGEDLSVKTKALQAALDAQAQQPTQKEP